MLAFDLKFLHRRNGGHLTHFAGARKQRTCPHYFCEFVLGAVDFADVVEMSGSLSAAVVDVEVFGQEFAGQLAG